MSKTIRPEHYKQSNGLYEPIMIISAWGNDFNIGNAVKYIARQGRKDISPASEDLKKAVTYLSFAKQFGKNFVKSETVEHRYLPNAVSNAWGLSEHLSAALFFIFVGDYDSAIIEIEKQIKIA